MKHSLKTLIIASVMIAPTRLLKTNFNTNKLINL